MKTTSLQQTFNAKTRSVLRLTEIERLIKAHRIIVPPLSRRTLSNMCDAGVFETAGGSPTHLGWLVYEDSFWHWAAGISGGSPKPDGAARGN